MIKVSGVDYNYFNPKFEAEALKDINFDLNKGEILSIIGPSGCGKTTLLSLLSGLLKLQHGEILYDGDTKIPKGFFGYMLQKDELFEWLTVKKNILLPLEILKAKTPENVAYAMELCEKYGLKDYIDKKPKVLSGGMRQRVALIRTLAAKPKVLLLDEPFSALDCQTKLVVQEDFLRIIKQEKETVILVTHDMEEAACLSDKVVVLSKRPATVKEVVVTKHKPDSTMLGRRESFKLSFWLEKIGKEGE